MAQTNFLDLKIKRILNKFVNYLKNNKRRIIINIIIFFSLSLVLLLFDQLTKYFIFDPKNLYTGGLIVFQPHSLIAFRSVLHHGVTIRSSLGINISFGAIHTITIGIIIFTLIGSIFSTNYFILIIFAFMFNGALGNGIDRLIIWNIPESQIINQTNSVRDIIYFPFFHHLLKRDLGTLNIADMYIVLSMCLFIIYFLISLVLNYWNSKFDLKTLKEKRDKLQAKIAKIEMDNPSSPLRIQLTKEYEENDKQINKIQERENNFIEKVQELKQKKEKLTFREKFILWKYNKKFKK
ncbi:signal peptidase II [Mycoplasma phocimorsus]|uniref:signal peptidase II n=1 Tax=Mycoplasma phocimorsus TaxID=3045839 RepID=UPI0024BF4766|nr:signal peptidase II [Mycoplasma phocimorsus]MDJ1646603.1 signal peptidase II [Mycoplasma phocimorsus]